MEKITDFIFELGQLRRISHEGWKLIGIHEPESVAEHSLRTAQIGYILALLECYKNPLEVCTICVFHDIGECRIGDIHKVGNRYLTVDETKVVKDQVKNLGFIGPLIQELWNQAEYQETTAGVIAKDADLLDMAFTAREYQIIGYT
ncbi:MAG: HD domain-containing protein, partial [Candidatus Thermoplasmatota archaeon]|nr:HD domain-containing protein [Candidatus Thermoplasmatota archaeon]MBU1940371.1 HD domain-containing protein [Candidatus Thermoplasmatota archaeon]